MAFPFGESAEVIQRLERAGYLAYAVGGAVRDFLLGRPVHDVDIATSARPDEVCQFFNKTIPIGMQHGTVAVLHKGKIFEVTTFRSEQGYDDFRHPNQVHFERTLDRDLMRRDFTMNALAMDLSGQIIDQFGGQSDMRTKIVRMVGNPEERINEDPLRMLRGMRFVAELGFTLGSDEREAFTRHASLLEKLSMERVDQEMTRLLAGPNAVQAIGLLYETHCIEHLPLQKKGQREAFNAIHFDMLQSEAERWSVFLAVLGYDQLDAFAGRWKWSGARKKAVKKLLRVLDERRRQSWSRWMVYKVLPETAYAVERVRTAIGEETLAQADETCQLITGLWNACSIHSTKELAVDGRDFLYWSGRKGGPWLASVLEDAERAVVCGHLANERSSIEQWFSAWQKEQKMPF
ncbi:CCA tRNA nucleotidyltransferase [Sporolactobacillus spathodeae]|uniref:CCA tRNA nucleotidyltransferase n=1 Tax=Sporolactobacillus spathodeae TaxID=1465502 RepID=UPI0039E87DBA